MDSVGLDTERGDAGSGLVLDLSQLASASLATVGGKALNLGRLVAADFPVPPGFCLTTAGYRISAPAELDAIATRLDGAGLDGAGLDRRCAFCLTGTGTILRGVRGRRWRLRRCLPPSMPPVRDAYAAMGGGPVAVRSSATAEDLPFASFAGQQDSFMDVAGADAVVDAVRRCWASLWTDRAVAYRTTNGISHREVGLAVVVQHMVHAGRPACCSPPIR